MPFGKCQAIGQSSVDFLFCTMLTFAENFNKGQLHMRLKLFRKKLSQSEASLLPFSTSGVMQVPTEQMVRQRQLQKKKKKHFHVERLK